MITAKPVKRTKFTAVVNPRKRRAARKSGAPRRKNPASTILLGYLNPEKTSMKKTNRKKIRRQVKRNPIVAKAVSRRHVKRNRPRRKNPLSMKGVLGRPVELLKLGAVGVIAYFATRQIPQMVLKSKNQSWLGYIANLVTALGSAAAADKYFGAAYGQAAFVGGGMYVVSRVVNDKTPLGATLNLQGLGDPAAAGGMRGLIPAFFGSPAITTRDGQLVPDQFQAVIDAAKAQIPAPAPAAAAGVSGGRFGSRFN